MTQLSDSLQPHLGPGPPDIHTAEAVSFSHQHACATQHEVTQHKANYRLHDVDGLPPVLLSSRLHHSSVGQFKETWHFTFSHAESWYSPKGMERTPMAKID